MSKTVKVIRDNALELIDATGAASSWGTTFQGEVDQHLDVVHDRAWSRILDVVPEYLMRAVSAVTDANGQFTVASLSDTTTSNDHKRFHKVLGFSDSDGVLYVPTKFHVIPTAKALDAQIYVWYRFGNVIQVLPKTSGKTYTVTVNYKPTKPTSFTTETQPVIFPDGWDQVLEFGLAARLLQKAGDDPNMAEYYRRQHDDLLDEMLQEIARDSVWPTFVGYTDAAMDWGG